MFYQLPPVGNPVLRAGNNVPESSLLPVFAPCQPQYFASGTAALAAALVAAIRKKDARHPEVVLPAWGCPDLVSAIVFAGAKPVLVDLEAERPWMALDQVAAAMSTDTVAIIAVDLFGIPERLDELRALADQADVVLVEDSAQYFPGNREQPGWQGDFVVLSFGRGKPASLLGGGAVLARTAELAGWLPTPEQQSDVSLPDKLRYGLKVGIYNAMIVPQLYWIPQRLPFLHLGETRYHPLESIDAMSPVIRKRLAANVEVYRAADTRVQEDVAAMMGRSDTPWLDLPSACGVPVERRLLRYPLLLNGDRRDQVYAALKRKGLGASLMYPAALPSIAGLEALLAGQGAFPAAEEFAARMLTLPLHRRVRSRDITAMEGVLRSA